MKKSLIFVILAVSVAAFLLFPSSAKACNVRPYALTYIGDIYDVFGGTKPRLVVENGKSSAEYGYYDKNTIHIYKGDYKGSCSTELPLLKSVIAHEYGHHVAGELGKISPLRGEKLAYVAEHSIGDGILGGAEYDNEAESQHLEDYEKIILFIYNKMHRIDSVSSIAI